MATVANEAEFKQAISSSEAEILISDSIRLTTPTSIGYAVKLKGGKDISLLWANPTAANPNMLIVTATGEVSMEALTLDAEERDGTLVQINGGSFTMDEDSIIRNVKSTRANGAVNVGAISSSAGGKFTMNGGLITGINSADAIYNCGGAVVMNGDAAISGNLAAGISMSAPITQESMRPSLTMTGSSRISECQSKDAGGAGIIGEGDVIMGVNENDTPSVTGNASPINCGAWFITGGSTLTMNGFAEISDNYAPQLGGGLGVTANSSVKMTGNSSIKKNFSEGGGGGIFLSESSLTIEEDACVSDNESGGERGGGIYMQLASKLTISGNGSVFGNKAVNGAGIYLNSSSASIGRDNSTPFIYNNVATSSGGGVFISKGSRLELTGRSSLYGNIAETGCGIYKMGMLELSRSPWISDGLYFDDLNNPAAVSRKRVETFFKVTVNTPKVVGQMGYQPISVVDSDEVDVTAARVVAETSPKYIDNVPVIADVLTGNAEILLEASGHVAPENVPLVIAEKGAGYDSLCESDRAAWHIPEEFGPGYSVFLTHGPDWAFIDYETYKISYYNLFGVDNPNPTSYRMDSIFPIVLADPGERRGYVFTGWYSEEGRLITDIQEGTIGDIVLIASWREDVRFCVRFSGNAPCVTNVPTPVCVGKGEKVSVPLTIPKKPRHCFMGWNTVANGSGRVYLPSDTIVPCEGGLTLYALWAPICERPGRGGLEEYCPKRHREC